MYLESWVEKKVGKIRKELGRRKNDQNILYGFFFQLKKHKYSLSQLTSHRSKSSISKQKERCQQGRGLPGGSREEFIP